jgi:hypothetical protein
MTIMLVQYQTNEAPVLVYQELKDGQALRLVDTQGVTVPMPKLCEVTPTNEDNQPDVVADGCEYVECWLVERTPKQKMLVDFEITESVPGSPFNLPKYDTKACYDLQGNPLQIDNPQIIRIIDTNPVLPDSLNA